MEKSIKCKISTNKEDIYKQYIMIMSCLPPFSGLRNKEREVFAELLYQYNRIPDIADEYKFKILFDYDTRVKMRDRLDISTSVFNNNLASLRVKNIITSENTIPTKYLFKHADINVITFELRIDE